MIFLNRTMIQNGYLFSKNGKLLAPINHFSDFPYENKFEI